MMFVLGLVLGTVVTFIGFVAVMAPRHWEWYHENIDLRKQLKVAVDRAAHYQALSTPNQWGPVEQHEARIVPKPPRPYDEYAFDGMTGNDIMHKFDDILDGGDS